MILSFMRVRRTIIKCIDSFILNMNHLFMVVINLVLAIQIFDQLILSAWKKLMKEHTFI